MATAFGPEGMTTRDALIELMELRVTLGQFELAADSAESYVAMQTEILDARTESRLRFNAIVAAWVVRARMVASAGPVNQVEVDAVYWPDDEEWEIEAIETI